jgi:putative transposase
MRNADSGGSALASLLDDSTAGELIPELARHDLQQLIELEVADVLGADRHEPTEERFGHCNGYRPRTLITQWAISHCRSPSCAPEASCPLSQPPPDRLWEVLWLVVREEELEGEWVKELVAGVRVGG